ncbi:MAG TPA: acyl-CoA desaturase [Acidimicrobiales bacterium]|nr:acyl-CoA desaturase [Acidimicrobiales bacterium]
MIDAELLERPPDDGGAATSPAVTSAVEGIPVDRAGAVDASTLGLATTRERTSRVSQVVTLVAVLVPPLAILSAARVLWGVAVRPLDLILFAVLYVATGLGITVGYHRLFTHRSFEAPTAVRVLLAILGAMTLQGPVTQWVTDHRKHHARSDVEGDPHSPHLSGDGLLGAVRGLWHSHVGWMFTTKGMERGDMYGRDLHDDRPIRFVDRFYLLWVLVSVALPFGIAWAVTGSVARGLEAMVWAGLVRIFAFEHATFAVNSICHTFGRRVYDARDQSRNNWVVALLTFGEGWHNNHHAFPRSARHGLGRLQVDVSYLVIRGLEGCRLAANLRLPTPAQQARARRVGAPDTA